MMLRNVFALLVCCFLAEGAKDNYKYIPSMGLDMKLHRIPTTWHEARFRCHLEGGYLASPENKHMLAAMIDIMKDGQNDLLIYTGIHATYSKGDYTTITGTPLSELDVEWGPIQPNNVHNEEDCVAVHSSGQLYDVKCTSEFPFLCHRSPEKENVHSCGNVHGDSDYVLYNETGSCYKFHKEGSTWPAAFRTCQAEGAYLAIINSEEESKILKELFAQNSPHTIPGGFHKDAASIGVTKWSDNHEWFTIHGQSLTEAGFSAFNAGEPNNIGGNETCASVWRTGLLNDHNCDILLTFICEKRLNSGRNK